MPNLKIYIDQDLHRDKASVVAGALAPIRACIMRHLGVTEAACQLGIVPVIGMPDQPLINVEIQILAHPDRTRPCVAALGQEVQAILLTATGAGAAFRCVLHDPGRYLALK